MMMMMMMMMDIAMCIWMQHQEMSRSFFGRLSQDAVHLTGGSQVCRNSYPQMAIAFTNARFTHDGCET